MEGKGRQGNERCFIIGKEREEKERKGKKRKGKEGILYGMLHVVIHVQYYSCTLARL